MADWPGLPASNLYQSRDLYPTTDIRSVFKGVLVEHMQLQENFVDRSVFPDAKPMPMIENLVSAWPEYFTWADDKMTSNKTRSRCRKTIAV